MGKFSLLVVVRTYFCSPALSPKQRWFLIVLKKSECMIQHCTRGGGVGRERKCILLSSYYSVPRVLTMDLAIRRTPSCAIGWSLGTYTPQQGLDRVQFDLAYWIRSRVVMICYCGFRCGPCRMMTPVFARLSVKYSAAVFLKVDVDQCQVRLLHSRVLRII